MKIEISRAGGGSSPGIRFPRTAFPFAGVGSCYMQIILAESWPLEKA